MLIIRVGLKPMKIHSAVALKAAVLLDLIKADQRTNRQQKNWQNSTNFMAKNKPMQRHRQKHSINLCKDIITYPERNVK